jgi:hypothetical protein
MDISGDDIFIRAAKVITNATMVAKATVLFKVIVVMMMMIFCSLFYDAFSVTGLYSMMMMMMMMVSVR